MNRQMSYIYHHPIVDKHDMFQASLNPKVYEHLNIGIVRRATVDSVTFPSVVALRISSYDIDVVSI
jgi:hypothetical protein